MSEQRDGRSTELTRRTFVKASGVAAGAGLLGAGAGSMGAVAHEAAIESEFLQFVNSRPDNVENSGADEYGEATAVAADPDEFDTDHEDFAGTDPVVAIAVDI